jgi:hypothetical protein
VSTPTEPGSIPSLPEAGGRVGFLVVGSPRSGTTLVQRLACEIPGVRMPPETHFFSEFVSGLMARRRFPLDADAIADEMGRFLILDSARGLHVDTPALVRDLGGTCASPYALFDALVRQLAGPAEVWGEKTPDHLLWWRPLAQAAPWLRFVVVVRDPRAVVASNLAMPWRQDGRIPAWGEQVHLAFAALWARLQRQVMAMEHTVDPGRRLVLRYEDVVDDPDAARRRIAVFLGRPPDAGLQAPPEDMVLPWEGWKAAALGPVTADRVTSWHETLGARRAADVAALCRSGMRHFGYDGAPGPVDAAVAWARLGPRNCARLVRYRRAYDGYLGAIDRRRL